MSRERLPPAHALTADLLAGYEMELALHESTFERIVTYAAAQILLAKMNDARTVGRWIDLNRQLETLCIGEIMPNRGSEYEC